jgi:hypothetical protein
MCNTETENEQNVGDSEKPGRDMSLVYIFVQAIPH